MGLTAGMGYGWMINPADTTSAEPETLRIDFKTDYVLMTAELYNAEQDPLMALARLRFFIDTPSLQLLNATIAYAETHYYAEDDIQSMRNLAAAVQQILPTVE